MSNDKTDLQREILLTWYEHPNATKKEISDRVGCSSSYVSTVTNRFDDYNEFEAMMDRQDRELEQMFGDDFFDEPAMPRARQPASGAQMGLAGMWEELPHNPVGNLVRGIILLLLGFVAYKIVVALVPLL
jgi:hypothetical protein